MPQRFEAVYLNYEVDTSGDYQVSTAGEDFDFTPALRKALRGDSLNFADHWRNSQFYRIDGPQFNHGEMTIRRAHMDYVMAEPDSIEPGVTYPLVVCLHGSGGRFTDQWWTAATAYQVFQSDNVPEAFVIAPRVVGGTNRWVDWSWSLGNYDSANVPESDEIALTFALVRHLVSTLPIDERRVYLTGQSMGGFGAFDMICRYPGYFAAAAPMAGGGDPAAANLMAFTPLWFTHGSLDTIILPETSREIAAALTAIGANFTYIEYEDLEHGVWIRSLNEPGFIEWMFAQRRETDWPPPEPFE